MGEATRRDKAKWLKREDAWLCGKLPQSDFHVMAQGILKCIVIDASN